MGGAELMRVVVQRYGGPEVLRFIDEDPGEPQAGEIRVRVHAAGVGFPDVLMREGTYPGGPKPPFTPGYDLVGDALWSRGRGEVFDSCAKRNDAIGLHDGRRC
jgi:hypothetical protein